MHPGVWMNLRASPSPLSLVVMTYLEGFVGQVKCILVCEWIYMPHLPTCPWRWWWLTLKSCWTGESHSGEHLWWNCQLCYHCQRHHQRLQIHQSAVASGCASWRWAAPAVFQLIIHSTSVAQCSWLSSKRFTQKRLIVRRESLSLICQLSSSRDHFWEERNVQKSVLVTFCLWGWGGGGVTDFHQNCYFLVWCLCTAWAVTGTIWFTDRKATTTTIPSIAKQLNQEQCPTAHFSQFNCPTAHCSLFNCSTAHFSLFNCPTAHFSLFNCPTAHFSLFNCPTAHFSLFNCPTAHFSPFNCPTSHFSPFNCPTSQFLLFNCPTSHFSLFNCPTSHFLLFNCCSSVVL